MSEKDPHGLSATDPGAKLDFGKSPVFRGTIQYFPRALRAVAQLSAFGAAKYSWGGWAAVPDGINRYTDALARHLTAEPIEGDLDKETGLPHSFATAWNALARLELILRKQEELAKEQIKPSRWEHEPIDL